MTLQEAIEIVEKEHKDHHSLSTDIIGQAEQLLIDIGKQVLVVRRFPDAFNLKTLPGETEE
jgi:hypothetical protein